MAAAMEAEGVKIEAASDIIGLAMDWIALAVPDKKEGEEEEEKKDEEPPPVPKQNVAEAVLIWYVTNEFKRSEIRANAKEVMAKYNSTEVPEGLTHEQHACMLLAKHDKYALDDVSARLLKSAMIVFSGK
jgi:hypothetical protein